MPYPVLPPDPPPLIATVAVTEMSTLVSVPLTGAESADPVQVDPDRGNGIEPLAIAPVTAAAASPSHAAGTAATTMSSPAMAAQLSAQDQAIASPASASVTPPEPPDVFPPESQTTDLPLNAVNPTTAIAAQLPPDSDKATPRHGDQFNGNIAEPTTGLTPPQLATVTASAAVSSRPSRLPFATTNPSSTPTTVPTTEPTITPAPHTDTEADADTQLPVTAPTPIAPRSAESVPLLTEFTDGHRTTAVDLQTSPASDTTAPSVDPEPTFGLTNFATRLPPYTADQSRIPPSAATAAQRSRAHDLSHASLPADEPSSSSPELPLPNGATRDRLISEATPLNPDELIFEPGQSTDLDLPEPSFTPEPIDETETEAGGDRPELVIPTTSAPDATATRDDAVTAPGAAAVPLDSPETLEEAILELTADRQVYDSINRIFRAEGRVIMRYGGAVIDADVLRVNLVDRVAVATGNVALTRGEQVVRGDTFEYNFVQQTGTLQGARGELFLPTAGSELGPPEPTDPSWGQRPLSDREQATRPLSEVFGVGSFNFSLGTTVDDSPQGGTAGMVNRFRFEADEIDFYPGGWTAQNLRLTNDPFSPPELEIRANEAEFVQVSPLRDEIYLSNPRAVFDQGLSIPLLRDRIVIDRRERRPGLFAIGFDTEDRGGFYIEREFEVVSDPAFTLALTPQILVDRAINSVGFGSPDAYGLLANVGGVLGPRTSYSGEAEFTTLDSADWRETIRASARLQQSFGDLLNPYRLRAEYNYRDRLFNGSLGNQDVRESIGIILQSPNIQLGNSGVFLSYQIGAQSIVADTDRIDLIDFTSGNFRANLGRFQATAGLFRSFTLWAGDPLPATADEGLRYTPNPVIPYVALGLNARATTSQYTNGESQDSLSGGVGLFGQFGHFSKPFFDYTTFNVQYSESLVNGQSPFFFDRIVDDRVLSYGLRQQLIGPIVAGFQRSINTDTNREISMNYSLEYSRRTYSIGVNFNATEEVGAVFIRINDFNWNGTPRQFDRQQSRQTGGGGIAP